MLNVSTYSDYPDILKRLMLLPVPMKEDASKSSQGRAIRIHKRFWYYLHLLHTATSRSQNSISDPIAVKPQKTVLYLMQWCYEFPIQMYNLKYAKAEVSKRANVETLCCELVLILCLPSSHIEYIIISRWLALMHNRSFWFSSVNDICFKGKAKR